MLQLPVDTWLFLQIGAPFVGVLRALLVGVHIRVPNFWKLPHLSTHIPAPR